MRATFRMDMKEDYRLRAMPHPHEEHRYSFCPLCAGRLEARSLKATEPERLVCVQCGFEYDEAKGWPEDGIAPGTRWDDIPEDWSCPDCGAAKSDFEMVEVARS